MKKENDKKLILPKKGGITQKALKTSPGDRINSSEITCSKQKKKWGKEKHL